MFKNIAYFLNLSTFSDWLETHDMKIFQWVSLITGFGLIFSGLSAIQNKKHRGRNGSLYTGLEAQIMGVICIILGIAMLILNFAVGSEMIE